MELQVAVAPIDRSSAGRRRVAQPRDREPGVLTDTVPRWPHLDDVDVAVEDVDLDLHLVPQVLGIGDRVTGQPHERNLDRWRRLVDGGDLPGMHRVLTGLDRDSIEMREVSPMSGLLNEEQRLEVLHLVG